MQNETHTIYKDFLSEATGPVAIPMTNDYLFRALLQENNKVLKGLLSSLLHFPIERIESVEIMNPIVLGERIEDKDFILDIKVLMNDNSIINLELQVINEKNWSERSLSYLCRSFDQLTRGQDYLEVKPVVQISILDFTLFPAEPEFYATYKFMNVKTHSLYSDKLTLAVLDLKRSDLATQEDKEFGIVYWATLFKAKTWEEIKMLAQDNEYIMEASDTILKLTEDEKVRMQCEVREDFYRRQRTQQNYMTQIEREADRAKKKLDEAQEQLDEINAELESKNAELESKSAELESKNVELESKNAELESKSAELESVNAELEAKDAELEAKDAELEAKDAEIARLKAMLEEKRK